MHWLPPNGALHGIALDALLRTNLAILFWLFIAAQLLIAIALLFRRSRRNAANLAPAPHADKTFFVLAELLPLLALTALYGWMLISGHRLWAASHSESAQAIATQDDGSPHSAIEVEITGVQFQWYFRYPGPDGIYGTTRSSLVSAPTGNPLGLDPADPHSADDIVSAILVLPANRAVDVTLRSQDVIHGLFIPGMRLKQDAIPGMTGHLSFTPTVPGDYPILCSQVCGLGHARMQARLRVVSPDDYAAWLAAREHVLSAEASR